MKYFLLVIFLFGCKKDGDNSLLLLGTWKFDEYVGAIPFVPADPKLQFTGTEFRRYGVDKLITSSTYELIDAGEDLRLCTPLGGFTRKMILNHDSTTRQYITIKDGKLHLHFGCPRIALVYRRN